MPMTDCPDKDVCNHRAQLVILYVIVTPWMENTGGVEEKRRNTAIKRNQSTS